MDINTNLKNFVKMIPLTILSILAFMVFSAVYSSGTVHRFPHAFAVDNEERLYQLFNSGGYCWTGDQMVGVLPPYEKVNALSISEDNLLSYARGNEVTVYDINQSDPASGKLKEIYRVPLEDADAYYSARHLHTPDEQNGVTYTYQGNSFSYQIMRTENGETSLFYQMPRADIIWNLIVNAYILIMVIGILVVIARFIFAAFEEQNRS
jgi:hypothetical protein